MSLAYEMDEKRPRAFGLVVLQTDETVEADLHRLLPDGSRLFVTRVPSGAEVTREALAAMEGEITHACSLLPRPVVFECVGYACTSGTSVIGAKRVAELVAAGCRAARVTEPVSALVARCRRDGVRRLGLVSPYVEDVSAGLRHVLESRGIDVPHFASFDVAEEAKVARIDRRSVENAARDMAARDVDAVFLSCTNLRTLNVIEGWRGPVPLLSSNSVLADALFA